REEESSKLIMGNVRRLRHINLSLLDFQGMRMSSTLANAITLSIDGLVLRKAFVTLRNMLLNELILTILMTCLFSNDNLVSIYWLTDYLRLPSYRLNYEVAF